MIARLARFNPMTPEVEAAMLDNLRVRFRDALDAQSGFVGGCWAKGADGSWISFNFWISPQALDRGSAAARSTPLKPGQRPELIPSPDSVEIFEVIETSGRTSEILSAG